MSTRTHWLYRLSDGRFTGACVLCAAADLAHNVPTDCGAVEAPHVVGKDLRRWLVTGSVQDDYGQAVPVLQACAPERPADTDEAEAVWDATLQDWVMQPTLAAQRALAEAEVLAQLQALDQRLTRPLSELMAAQIGGQVLPEDAQLRVSQIMAEKAGLRQCLAQIRAATTQAELVAAQALAPDLFSGGV